MKSSDNRRFSHDFMGNTSESVCSDLLNIGSEVWRRCLTYLHDQITNKMSTKRSETFSKHFTIICHFTLCLFLKLFLQYLLLLCHSTLFACFLENILSKTL